MKVRFILLLLILLLVLAFYQYGRTIWYPYMLKIKGKETVAQVIDKYEEDAFNELKPKFEQQGVYFPPRKLALLAFKDTRVLELWAANENDKFQHILSYPILAASGKLGPKLREGDKQVPEGIYKVIGFNPNSAFHLSMKLNYPNNFDLMYAKKEQRDEPGTNIFIHGRESSIGCLAMGDSVIEELFTLIHAVGKSNTQILIAPTDPSKQFLKPHQDMPAWTKELYNKVTDKYFEITDNKKPAM